MLAETRTARESNFKILHMRCSERTIRSCYEEFYLMQIESEALGISELYSVNKLNVFDINRREKIPLLNLSVCSLSIYIAA